MARRASRALPAPRRDSTRVISPLESTMAQRSYRASTGLSDLSALKWRNISTERTIQQTSPGSAVAQGAAIPTARIAAEDETSPNRRSDEPRLGLVDVEPGQRWRHGGPRSRPRPPEPATPGHSRLNPWVWRPAMAVNEAKPFTNGDGAQSLGAVRGRTE
jgi:hypothetical protein